MRPYNFKNSYNHQRRKPMNTKELHNIDKSKNDYNYQNSCDKQYEKLEHDDYLYERALDGNFNC